MKFGLFNWSYICALIIQVGKIPTSIDYNSNQENTTYLAVENYPFAKVVFLCTHLFLFRCTSRYTSLTINLQFPPNNKQKDVNRLFMGVLTRFSTYVSQQTFIQIKYLSCYVSKNCRSSLNFTMVNCKLQSIKVSIN